MGPGETGGLGKGVGVEADALEPAAVPPPPARELPTLLPCPFLSSPSGEAFYVIIYLFCMSRPQISLSVSVASCVPSRALSLRSWRLSGAPDPPRAGYLQEFGIAGVAPGNHLGLLLGKRDPSGTGLWAKAQAREGTPRPRADDTAAAGTSQPSSPRRPRVSLLPPAFCKGGNSWRGNMWTLTNLSWGPIPLLPRVRPVHLPRAPTVRSLKDNLFFNSRDCWER